MTVVAPKGLAHRDSPRWQRWGNVTDDIYLFAFQKPTNVQLVLAFRKLGSHQLEAAFYTGSTIPKNPKRAALDGMLSADTPRFRVVSQQGGWMVHNKANFNLLIESYRSGRLTTQQRVGSRILGVPQWQVSRLVYNPHPQRGIPRFGATLRMPGAPPYKVQKPILPGFPLFGVGNGEIDWFSENPAPFYLNVHTFKLESFPIVGFEEGGMFRFNSLSYPPHVDFESPFGFYNFVPDSRYAQLVVRSQSFPIHDIFGPVSPEFQRSYFRMSWKMQNQTLWRYSLSVQGFFPFTHQIDIGGVQLWAEPFQTYPKWVASQKWPYVTFVQSMHGYPGSEGIYFDSGSATPSVWPWLLGLRSMVPTYLSYPYLPPTIQVTNQTSRSLPPYFRAEYSAAYFRRPTFYVSPVDGLLHLLYARGGVYNLGQGKVIEEQSLNDGPYIDSWRLVDLPSQVTRLSPLGKTISKVVAADGYVFYTGPSGVAVVQHGLSPVVSNISPPTNAASWQRFIHQVKPFEQGKEAVHLGIWPNTLSGPRLRLPEAQWSDFHLTSSGLQVTLTIFSVNGESGQLPGVPIPHRPGTYVLSYDLKTGKWTTSEGTAPQLAGNIEMGTSLTMGTRTSVRLAISNGGNEDWHGPVILKAGHKVVWSGIEWVDGHSLWRKTISWSPTAAGAFSLQLLAGSSRITQRPIVVGKAPRPTPRYLVKLALGPGGVGEVLLGLACMVMGGSLTIWRRIASQVK
ncbi:MAG: hypothetical protein JJ714_00105 [Acidithiobacillus sp.]|nr:hypothetical protein [Acidithiobacillus sp.]